MALHLLEGFDYYSVIADMETYNNYNRSGTISAASISAGGGRFGGNSLNIVQSNPIINMGWGNNNSNRLANLDPGRYTGFALWLNFSQKPSGTAANIIYGNVSGGQNALGLNTAGQFIYDGAVALTTQSVCDAQWHWVEFLMQTNSNNADIVKMTMDGTVYINSTHNSGATAQNFGVYFQNANVAGLTTKYDDVFYYDNVTSGITGDLTAASYPIGPKKVTTLRPTGAGTLTGWTPLSSTNVSNIDDTNVPDGDTTYNSTSGSTIRDSFVCGDISTGDTNPLVAFVRVCCKNNAAGTGSSIVGLTDSSGTVGLSESCTLGNAYNTKAFPIFRDPATSAAWTTSGINSAEFGYGTV